MVILYFVKQIAELDIFWTPTKSDIPNVPDKFL